ncbi:25429_t:CDS:2 [Racocetra persica]|uniref:25429_t:CDS:1 n=1 Tax=Racocetra persica TaxID=160502 RepID=A0ACA9R1P5_9GLOM|nr:25429_t:CDS:2 [Racocetra persica]
MESEDNSKTSEQQSSNNNNVLNDQGFVETIDTQIVKPMSVNDQGFIDTVDVPVVGKHLAVGMNWTVSYLSTRGHRISLVLSDNMNLEASVDVEQAFLNSLFRLPNISFNEAHIKISYCKAYTTMNRLSKKAIQAGLDAGSNAIKELKDFMSGFIIKYTPKKKDKKKKRQDNESDDTSNYSFSDEDFILVENLIVHSKRGAPRKKRLKGSHELESKSNSSAKHLQIQKTRKLSQC